VILIYDIFGFFPQTFQGADRLAARLNGLVIIPDFFRGGGMPQHALPPDTEEKKEIIAKFRREKASFEANLPVLLQVAEEVKRQWPDVTAWGTLGLCWAGKVCQLLHLCGLRLRMGALKLILGVVGVSGLGEGYTFQGLRTGIPSVSRSILSLTSREFKLADHFIDN
jgi:hypothetical protein